MLSSFKIEDSLYHLRPLDGVKLDFIETGNKTTFLKIFDKGGERDSQIVHHGYKCAVTGECPIIGPMHFYYEESNMSKMESYNNWQFLSREGYEQVKDTLPEVCYFTKYPIDNIQEKFKPQTKYCESDESVKEPEEGYPKYVCKAAFHKELDELIELKESEIFE